MKSKFGQASEGYIDNDYFRFGKYSMSMSEFGSMEQVLRDVQIIEDANPDELAENLYDMFDHDPAIPKRAVISAYKSAFELELDPGNNIEQNN